MHRLAVIASHPIQYHAPWYRALATRLDLHVYYAHRASAADQAAAGFGVPFEWDTPLLEGYRSSWLANRAARPGVHHFFGCNTPEIRAILRQKRHDAVLVNGWNLLCYWQAATAARKAGIPVLARGDSQLLTPRGWLWRVLKRGIYPVLLRRFDAFLSVGRRHADYLKHYGVPSQKIFEVPHCVDNDFFRARAAAARQTGDALRRRFGIPERQVVFLFAGKFTDQKRPLDFLAALDEARRRGANAWGLLVGDGPLRAAMEKHIQARGTPCALAGFLNQGEIGAAYAAADALVLPSDGRETWGLVANEAMACGVPVIVSDQAGCAPDLVVAGKTGFTYPCGQVNELAACMTRLTEDQPLRTALAGEAERRARRFSLDAACAGLLAALAAVVPRSNPS